jgi:hypothetical protein
MQASVKNVVLGSMLFLSPLIWITPGQGGTFEAIVMIIGGINILSGTYVIYKSK